LKHTKKREARDYFSPVSLFIFQIVFFSAFKSIGFDICASIPASRLFWTSSVKAFAVIAMIGILLALFSKFLLIRVICKRKDQKIFFVSYHMMHCFLKHLCLGTANWFDPTVLNQRISLFQIDDFINRKIIRCILLQLLNFQKRFCYLFVDSKNAFYTWTYVHTMSVFLVHDNINTIKIPCNNIR
jgi:hypothetical protein